MILRSELTACLKRVAPALATSDTIPNLTQFWFTGQTVIAFNDEIGISHPCMAPLKCGVRGSLLLEILDKATPPPAVKKGKKGRKGRQDVVEFEVVDKTGLKFKAYRTTVQLATMDIEMMLWNMPALDESKILKVNANEFLEGLEACKLSVGSDTSRPDTLGLTLIADSGVVTMFTTNGPTVTRVRLSTQAKKLGKRVILPWSFCEQLLRFADKRDKKLHLELHDDYVLFASNGVRLFGRLIASERPMDFAAIIEEYAGALNANHAVAIPKQLKDSLERALIITNNPTEQLKTQFAITADAKGRNVLKLVSKSKGIADIRDAMTIGEEHPEIVVHTFPAFVRAACHMSRICFTQRCIVIMDDEKDNRTTYMVGLFGD